MTKAVLPLYLLETAGKAVQSSRYSVSSERRLAPPARGRPRDHSANRSGSSATAASEISGIKCSQSAHPVLGVDEYDQDTYAFARMGPGECSRQVQKVTQLRRRARLGPPRHST